MLFLRYRPARCVSGLSTIKTNVSDPERLRTTTSLKSRSLTLNEFGFSDTFLTKIWMVVAI